MSNRKSTGSSSSSSWEDLEEDVSELLDYTEIEASRKSGVSAGGSTGALLLKYMETPYIYKYGPPANVVNEFVAFKLYAAAGARVPRAHLVINREAGGIPQGVLIQMIPGVTVANAFKTSLLSFGEKITLYATLKNEFLLHALFANWDVKNSENHIIPVTKYGKYKIHTPYTIDMGGALFYRASGALKPTRFFTSLDTDEMETIPANSATTTSRLFTYPAEEDLRKPHVLHRNVCSRLATLNTAAIFDEIRRLASLQENKLFTFYPDGYKLQSILEGRLVLLHDFCKTGKLREAISAAASKREGSFSIYDMYRINTEGGKTYEEYGEEMHSKIVESMKTEVFKPLQLHGKRSLVDLGGITATDAERIVLAAPLPAVRTGGGAAAGWNEDDYDDEDEYVNRSTDGYPAPAITITLDGTAEAMTLKHKMLAQRTDPLLRSWLEAQTAFLQSGLTTRERNILISYTKHGDRLANNYLRRTLKDSLKELMDDIIAGPMTQHQYSVPLAYSLLDQLDGLMYEKRHLLTLPTDWIGIGDVRHPSALLLGGGADGKDVNMASVAIFMDTNRVFFESPRLIESLLAQYVRDLYAIMKKAPRAPHSFTVFRGFKSDSYLSALDFRAIDFLSTSIDPETVYKSFLYHVEDNRILRKYSGSLYEMEVRQNVPCIYMESITQFPTEFEILIAPGVVVETDKKVYMKYFGKNPDSIATIQRESSAIGTGSFVAVVECNVRLPKVGERAGQLVALGDMRVRGPVRDVSERFSSAKPRGERPGRGHKKRITWKMNRQKGRTTRRVSS